MSFNKALYWKNKENNIGSKRPKAQITPTGEAQLIFVDNNIISNNRKYRRRKIVNRLYTRKGYINYLNAIRITRIKHGKTTIKYINLNKSVI